MKHWRYYEIGSGLAVVAGLVLSNPLKFGICNRVYIFNGKTGCLDSSIRHVGEPLLIFSVVVFMFFLACLFFSNTTRLSWLRFALWWLPLSAILIAITPVTNSNWLPMYSIENNTVTVLMASLFTIISLGIIAWKQFGPGSKAK